MSSIREDTIGGFNTFLDEQHGEPGSATVSLYNFDTNVDLVFDDYPIVEAPKLTEDNYRPGGRTALHDAISTAVTETADLVRSKGQSERPDNVIIVTLTDGKENASETPHDRLREQVREYREEYDWEFLFIGANQEAALTASSMGMDEDNSLDMAHSGEGAQAAYDSTSEQVSQVRREGETHGFDEIDRNRQEDA